MSTRLWRPWYSPIWCAPRNGLPSSATGADRDLLDSHETVTRRHVGRFLGRAVNTTGDGFIAEFDAPGHAISCALAIRDDLEAIGLEIFVGIHTGEVERRADDVGGIAAHGTAARVQAAAEPGEVLVPRTVHDLLAGSVFKWTDRGLHRLKGLSEGWQLYHVDAGTTGDMMSQPI